MSKAPKHHNRRWTPQDIAKLEKLAKGNTPTRLIAYELDRSEPAVYSKASAEGIGLKPTNQSPYSRRKSK